MRLWGRCAVALVTGAVLAGCGGGSSPTTSTTTSTSPPGASLQPAALGAGQCPASLVADGSAYGQVAVHDASCSTVVAIADQAPTSGTGTFSSNGYTCTPTEQGASSPWASAWGGEYVSYSCTGASGQLAFNRGVDYIYEQAVGGSTGTGSLRPAKLGLGECQAAHLADGATYAQIALSNAACSTAVDAATAAPAGTGADFTWNGFSCTATTEGAGSPWAAAWAGAYVAYSCHYGDEQVAFTLGRRYIYP